MKNPNGYGTVVKLSGNRRNPYAVRKTDGFDERGYPIYINIGYAPTKEAGLIMLAEYNKSPWDIKADKITFKELYELWLEKRAPKLGKANFKALKYAYAHCKKLDHMKYSQIKAYHMQDCIDSCGHGYATQEAIRNLFNHLDRLAMELDVISKQYSVLLKTAERTESHKKVFTNEEIELLWNNQQIEWVDSVLFFLYTGFRISEFCAIRIENVDLESDIPTIKGGGKTAAGKDRIVPVHSKIFEIVQFRAEHSKQGFLFEWDGRPLYDSSYRSLWNDVMRKLNMQHTPHECRHTFRSRLDSAGANKVCIDLMMGHKSNDVGERIYTHKTISELKLNIELITN